MAFRGADHSKILMGVISLFLILVVIFGITYAIDYGCLFCYD